MEITMSSPSVPVSVVKQRCVRYASKLSDAE